MYKNGQTPYAYVLALAFELDHQERSYITGVAAVITLILFRHIFTYSV